MSKCQRVNGYKFIPIPRANLSIQCHVYSQCFSLFFPKLQDVKFIKNSKVLVIAYHISKLFCKIIAFTKIASSIIIIQIKSELPY